MATNREKYLEVHGNRTLVVEDDAEFPNHVDIHIDRSSTGNMLARIIIDRRTARKLAADLTRLYGTE